MALGELAAVDRRGTIRRPTATTASPIGTLTRKIAGQLNACVRMPPARTPEVPPSPAIAPQIPRARLRSAPSAKLVVMIARLAGEMTAAPSP